jgi:hypothetical protein
VFKTNTFNIPLHEDKLTKNPTINVNIMVAPQNREENASEASLIG